MEEFDSKINDTLPKQLIRRGKQICVCHKTRTHTRAHTHTHSESHAQGTHRHSNAHTHTPTGVHRYTKSTHTHTHTHTHIGNMYSKNLLSQVQNKLKHINTHTYLHSYSPTKENYLRGITAMHRSVQDPFCTAFDIIEKSKTTLRETSRDPGIHAEF